MIKQFLKPAAIALSSLFFTTCLDSIVGAECKDNLTACTDGCYNLENDNSNCGSCGNVCSEYESCNNGLCIPKTECADGQVECNSECVDLLTDRENCGECFNSCKTDEICSAGSCIPDCKNLSWCPPSGCVDILSDNSNCGSCGNECPKELFCAGGTCTPDCEPPFTACGQSCIDLLTNPFNCGSCGNSCDSGICVNGVCRVQNAGHLLILGHDYTQSHTALMRIIGNGVFISPENPVKVLGYTEYADTAPGGQVEKVNSAIEQNAQITGRSWQKKLTSSVIETAENLLKYDVLILYAQNRADDSQIKITGNKFFSVLNNFLSIGGIIILTEGPGKNSGSWKLLKYAGLFNCDSTYNCTDCTAQITDAGDALAQGVSTFYWAPQNSTAFKTSQSKIVAKDQNNDGAILIHKIFKPVTKKVKRVTSVVSNNTH
jgi:hypothetical protein